VTGIFSPHAFSPKLSALTVLASGGPQSNGRIRAPQGDAGRTINNCEPAKEE